VKIYVASDSLNDKPDQLVKQLARIKLRAAKTTPVIVVNERYNLDTELGEEADESNIAFHLDDFLHEKSSIADGVMLVDANQIGIKLCVLDSKWVVFEFHQNDQQPCLDFIRKLARYNYAVPTLRNKSVVFSVPSVLLAYYARIVNESFKNLPLHEPTNANSVQISYLMFSARVESAFMSLPLPTALLSWFNRLSMFIFKRYVRITNR
jgi:hypothetical protein